MKFECHHEMLKRLSKFGSVKVSGLSNSPNVTKETIRSDLNELARLGHLTRHHDGAFIALSSPDIIAKNEVAYALENYDTTQGIKRGHSTMKSQVYVTGSFNVDIVSYLPRLPTIGEPLPANNFIFSPGGRGCNQALTADFAGTDVCFITRVGTDRLSNYAISFMNLSRICKSIICQTKETRTGTATVLVNEGAGDNIIAIYSGANVAMSSDEITIQKGAIINSDVILLQLGTNYTALRQATTLTQKNSIPATINPAPCNDVVNELIQDVDYIIPNETKAGLLSGIGVYDPKSTKQVAKAIHNKGIKDTVITLGSKGSFAFDGKRFVHSPAFPAAVKNTTGAGDTLNGTLASGLAKGKSLEPALCYTSASVSLVVEASNASDVPEHESVMHRIRGIHYQQTIFTH